MLTERLRRNLELLNGLHYLLDVMTDSICSTKVDVIRKSLRLIEIAFHWWEKSPDFARCHASNACRA